MQKDSGMEQNLAQKSSESHGGQEKVEVKTFAVKT